MMKKNNVITLSINSFFKSVLIFIKKIWGNPQGRVGIIIIACLAVIALLAPVIAPYDPYDVALRDDKGLAPSAQHLLGTSITTGQDVFSMLLYGTRVSICIGLVTGLAIALLGSALRSHCRICGDGCRHDYHARGRRHACYPDPAADNPDYQCVRKKLCGHCPSLYPVRLAGTGQNRPFAGIADKK